MIKVCAIASGSNGNCYYIGDEHEAILVDAGLSCRQIEKRMKVAGLDIAKVKAVFITHEHADHVRGVGVLCNKHKIMPYFTEKTWKNTYKKYRPQEVLLFDAGACVLVGGFRVYTFLKSHDAAEPTSFRVEIGKYSVGVMTDVGEGSEQFRSQLQRCDVAFLEANYDPMMLADGPYPDYLKKRVASPKGHLSNLQALELVQQLGANRLKTIFLSHISNKNNTEELALAAFSPLAEQYQILSTSRYDPSEVLSLT